MLKSRQKRRPAPHSRPNSRGQGQGRETAWTGAGRPLGPVKAVYDEKEPRDMTRILALDLSLTRAGRWLDTYGEA